MKRPLLLDLFCGAGGAAMGYRRAGFEVVGVDTKPQPHYPFEFIRADAMAFPLEGFDVIHASPPCQAYSKTAAFTKRDYPDLVGVVRDRLALYHYVIENVVGAPIRKDLVLCGEMFGLRVIRHRAFESSLPLLSPAHQKHRGGTNAHRGYSKGAHYVCVAGHNYNTAEGKRAMDIDWMTRDELNEAIPPAYTEHIGRQLIGSL
jgi:DNA (cytosine-5)-methyltransferase 1